MSATSTRPRPRTAMPFPGRCEARAKRKAPSPSSSRPRSRPRSRSSRRTSAGDYLAALGLDEPGLNRLIRAGYELLGLITYFTAGPKEARAWTIDTGTRAPQAAGVIHTDFEKGFIRAETIAYDEYVALRRRGRCPRRRQAAARRQGLRRRGRRRACTSASRPEHFGADIRAPSTGDKYDASAAKRRRCRRPRSRCVPWSCAPWQHDESLGDVLGQHLAAEEIAAHIGGLRQPPRPRPVLDHGVGQEPAPHPVGVDAVGADAVAP